MYNDNIELLKLVHLSQFDIDYERTTVHVDMSNNEITINLFINPSMRDCPYCKSTHSIIHARVLKRIYHPVIENRICIILLHYIKFKCNECGHYFMQFNPIVSGSKNISTLGELYILENLRKNRKTFKDISNELFIPHTSVIRCFDEHVNIDMWETYKIVAEKSFPNATICVDSFHVIKHLNDAMDKIRLHVQKRFVEHMKKLYIKLMILLKDSKKLIMKK